MRVANAGPQDGCDALPEQHQQALLEMERAFDEKVGELEAEHQQNIARRDAAHEAAVAGVEAAGPAALSARYLWFARQLRR